MSFACYIWINSYKPDQGTICTKCNTDQNLTYETSSLCLKVHKNNSEYSERNSTELLLFCTSEYRPTYDPTLLMTLSGQEAHADIVVWGMFWGSDLLAWTGFTSKAPTWPLLTPAWPPGVLSWQQFNQQNMQKSEGQFSVFVCKWYLQPTSLSSVPQAISVVLNPMPKTW